MRIKKFSTIWIIGLVLTGLFLTAFTIFRYAFTKDFAIQVQSNWIIAVGAYIDANLWLYFIACILSNTLVCYLYSVFLSKSWKLSWKSWVAISTAIPFVFISHYLPSASYVAGVLMLLSLGLAVKSQCWKFMIIFAIDNIFQVLSMEVRGLLFYLADINFATVLVFSLDSYLWLLMLAFAGTAKKKEVKNGNV